MQKTLRTGHNKPGSLFFYTVQKGNEKMKKQKTKGEPVLYKILRPGVIGMFKILYKPSIIGRQYIPKEGRVVLAGNHTSNLDCFMLAAATGRCVHFLGKDELFRGGLGLFFKGLGVIPVNRRTRDVRALLAARTALNEDKIIGIFPEGTINKTDDVIMPFKIGAVKMAHDTGSQIVPFAIKGKYRLFDRGAKIIFYPPQSIESDDLAHENKLLMERVSSALSNG